jgi:hypothetical protein
MLHNKINYKRNLSWVLVQNRQITDTAAKSSHYTFMVHLDCVNVLVMVNEQGVIVQVNVSSFPLKQYSMLNITCSHTFVHHQGIYLLSISRIFCTK